MLNKETESTIGELFIFIPIPVFRYDFLPKIVDLTTTPTIFLFLKYRSFVDYVTNIKVIS